MHLHCTLPEESERTDKRRRGAVVGSDGERSKRRRSDAAQESSVQSQAQQQQQQQRPQKQQKQKQQQGQHLEREQKPTAAQPPSLSTSSAGPSPPLPLSRSSVHTLPKTAAADSYASAPPPFSAMAAPSSHSRPTTAPDSEEQAETDFLYSNKEEKDRPRLGPIRAPMSNIGRGGQAKRVVGPMRKQPSAAVQKAAAQNAMLVHGCPMWVYSDLMARFDLLREPSAGTSINAERIEGSDLNTKLMALSASTIAEVDDVLEDARLTLPHIPLLQHVLTQQAERYNPGRLLLLAMLIYLATDGGSETHSLVAGLSSATIADVKAFVQHQTLNTILFSPIKSRELALAIELLAIYDPLLSHVPGSHLETPSFILPTSFYLDSAIGAAYRFDIESSVRKLQQWYLEASSAPSRASAAPMPANIVDCLVDASLWMSLEVHTAEVNRNLQGMTECFAKDFTSMWPVVPGKGREATPTFAKVVEFCIDRLPTQTQDDSQAGRVLSVGSKLGLVNLAFRHSGLLHLREVLASLYDGVPDVPKIDYWYTFLEDGLAKKYKDYGQVNQRRVLASEGEKASTHIVSLAGGALERELAWMQHFWGGYCFAILLLMPSLQRSKKKQAGSKKGSVSVSATEDDRGSTTPAGERSPRFHAHGVHDADLAKSVIDALKDKNSNPDTIMADAAAGGKGVGGGGVSPFEFLAKHNSDHDKGLRKFLMLTLETNLPSRVSDTRRAVTNSRLIYACKEVIENHATRKRGWGKIGEDAGIHLGLLRQICDTYKVKSNALDRGLAKLTRMLEKILDRWRAVKVEPPTAPTGPSPPAPRNSGTRKSMLGRPKGHGQGQGQRGQGREGVPAPSHPGPDRRGSISAGYGLPGGPPPSPGMRPQQYNGQGGHLSRPSFSHQSTSPTQYQMGFVPQPQQQQQQQAPSPSSLQQQQQSQQGIPYLGPPPPAQSMLQRGHHQQQQQQQPSTYGMGYSSGDGALNNGNGGNGPGFASNGSSPASNYSQQQQQQQQYPVLPPPLSHQPMQQAGQQYAQQQPQQQQTQPQQQQQLLPSLLDFDIFAADDDPNAAPSLLDFDVDNLWQNFSGPTGLMMDSLGVPAAMAAANNAGGGMGDAGAAAMGGLTGSAGASGFTPNSEAGSSQMQGAGMGPQGDATGGFSNGALAGAGMGGGEGNYNGSGGAGGATSSNDGQMLGFGNPGGMMMGDIDFSGMSGLFQ